MARNDPIRNNRFQVDIGDDTIGFREVTIPEMTAEPIEYREGNEKSSTVRKIPGLEKYGNINLKRGITDSTALYDWYDEAILKNNKESMRRNITIEYLDEKGETAIKTWNCINCWPTKYKAADINATANEIAIEELELVTEGITLQK